MRSANCWNLPSAGKRWLSLYKPCKIPAHRGRTDCCGRSERPARGPVSQPKWKSAGPGIRLYPDGHIEMTPAALRRRKNWLLQQGAVCEACKEPFDDYREVELGHREPKGMNGWKRNDSGLNTCLLHKSANRDQGSMPLDLYLANKWKPEICKGL